MMHPSTPTPQSRDRNILQSALHTSWSTVFQFQTVSESVRRLCSHKIQYMRPLLAVALCVARAAAVVITFSVNAETDFDTTVPGVFKGTGQVVSFNGGSLTGWSFQDVRFSYDLASDTGYFGAYWRCAAAHIHVFVQHDAFAARAAALR